MNCPRCKTAEARKHQIYGVMPCLECQNKDVDPGYSPSEDIPISRLDRIQQQRDHSGADMIQPYADGKPNREFFKHYPEMMPSYKLSKSEMKEIDL